MKTITIIRILGVIISLGLIIGGVRPATGAELGINCSSDNSCEPVKQDAFFSWDNAAPGQSKSFKINLVNKSGSDRDAYFNLSPSQDNPSGGFKLTIKDKDTTLYYGFLTDEVSLNLGAVASGETKTLELIINAESQADNSWQGKSIKFNSNLYIESDEPSQSSTISPSPAPTPHQQPSTTVGQLFNPRLTNLQQVLGQTNLDDILASQTARPILSWWAGRLKNKSLLKILGIILIVISLTLMTQKGLRGIFWKRGNNYHNKNHDKV